MTRSAAATSGTRGGGCASKVQLHTLHLQCECHVTEAWRVGNDV